jgi:hypothetical protein
MFYSEIVPSEASGLALDLNKEGIVSPKIPERLRRPAIPCSAVVEMD